MKSVKSPKTPVAKVARNTQTKTPAKLPADKDQLILENLSAITQDLQALTLAVDDHVLKTVNIANHVVALEAVLAEVVALTGLDMVKVNNRIRAKISSASLQNGASDYAIDLAASIVSPTPRI